MVNAFSEYTKEKTMKKIISILIVAILVVSSILAMIPVSAADAKATYKVKWSKLKYDSYEPSSESSDSATKNAASSYENIYSVEKTDTSISSSTISTGVDYYYIANTKFTLAEGAQFEYEFKVKLNATQKFAGVVYAIDGDSPYMVYGCFDNNSQNKSGKSEFRFSKGGRKNELQDIVYTSIDLDSGYASLKVVFDGFNASIFVKKDGSYQQQGGTISLPSSSQIALGVFSRDGRTVKVKDAVLYGMNDAAAKLVKSGEAGFANTINDYVKSIQTEHKEADYTADSYAPLKTALDAAIEEAKKLELSQENVDTVKAAIDKAVAALVPNTNIDATNLKKVIAEADALVPYKVEYTTISFAMVTKAVDDAKELMGKEGVKQSELDAAADVILGRIKELVPSGLKVQRPTNSAATGMVESDSETLAVDDGGCGSAVATTAVVVGIVATLGTALVIKKKD